MNTPRDRWSHWSLWSACVMTALSLSAGSVTAQQAPSPSAETVQLQVNQLAGMVAHEQAMLEASQRQIELLRQQVAALQGQLAAASPPPAVEAQPEQEVARLNASLDSLRERQDMQQSELATHEQAKIESESRFPVKLTGLILMNAFVNSSAVDAVQSPSAALGDGGTTGITLRQTVLGLDARGPHLFGSDSSADVRVDFFGGGSQAGYGQSGGTVRLRTAHAELAWNRTRAFAAFDRPVINPNAPASLTAVAQPALAWSGNLWNWIPQTGVEQTLHGAGGARLSLQAAIADVPDAFTPQSATAIAPTASLGEHSRWPASQARVGYARGDQPTGFRLGVGGYFSPHTANSDVHFDAWASTIDYRIPLFAHLEFSGSLYRGAALGGLGAGAYKDYVYKERNQYYDFKPLDDVGGWAQLKARANERLEFNVTYGLDNAFAHQIRPYLTDATAGYLSLSRNATFYTNVIYSPTAYTLFSLEYRRIDTSYALSPNSVANILGVAAGYRF